MRFFLVLVTLLLFWAGPGHGAEIVAVSSSRIAPYQEALAGFRAMVDAAAPLAGPKSISPHTITEFVVAEEPGLALLRAKIRSRNPDLLLAVGSNGLRVAAQLRDIPTLYLMVPRPGSITRDHSQVTGVEMVIPPEQQLDALLKAAPATRRLGLVATRGWNREEMARIRVVAEQRGIELVPLEVNEAREVVRQIKGLAGRIDALWMLPDAAAITPETVEAILLFSLDHRVPVLTFSDKYVRRGATLAVTFDAQAMGRQAGMMALEFLGERKQLPAPALAEKVRISVNESVAARLGLDLDSLATDQGPAAQEGQQPGQGR